MTNSCHQSNLLDRKMTSVIVKAARLLSSCRLGDELPAAGP